MAAGQLENEAGRNWKQIRENLQQEIEEYEEDRRRRVVPRAYEYKEEALYELFSTRMEDKPVTDKVGEISDGPIGNAFNLLEEIGFIDPRVQRGQLSEKRYETDSYTARDLVKMDRLMEELRPADL